MANRIIKIFMDRDGLTEDEARREFHLLKGELFAILEDMDDPFWQYEEAQDLLADYGLEPDYLDDLLF